MGVRRKDGRRWTLAALLGCVALLILAPSALAASTGNISGTVTSACACEDFNPLKNIEVTVYEAEGKESQVGVPVITNGEGKYTVEGLDEGSYKVEFFPKFESGLNFVTQYYKNASSFATAAKVKVAKGKSTIVNAELQIGGEVSGTVTDASTHAPVSKVINVFAVSIESQKIVEAALTNAKGEYTLRGLETGEYEIVFEDLLGGSPSYIGQFYDDQQSPLTATRVKIEQGQTTAGIDAALVREEPVDTTAPVAAGTPAVGSTLSCSTGSWTGSPTLTFAYAWLRNGSAIAGATGSTYVVQSADLRTGLACEVTATNKSGNGVAVSNTLTVPAPPSAAPTPTSTPPPPPPKPEVKLSSAKLLVSGGSVRVPLSCAQATCGGTIELTEQIFIESSRGTTLFVHDERLLLGKGSYALSAGQHATILLRLTATGKKALVKAKHHRLNAMTLVSVMGGGTAIRESVLLSELVHGRQRK